MMPMDQVLTEAQVSKVYELTDGLLLNRDWVVVPLIGMVDGMEMLMPDGKILVRPAGGSGAGRDARGGASVRLGR